jgi:hypothetical protein
MYEIGLLGGRTGMLAGMVLAFNIALAPVFLRLMVSSNAGIRSLATALLTASFVIVTVLMAILVYRSHAYRSKAQWRIASHALWLMSGIFLVSLFVPLSFAPVAEFPGRFFLWIVALAAVPIYQRIASNFVANLAQPARGPSPVAVSGAPPLASNERSSAHAPNQSSDDRGPHHERHPRRNRGRFRRHSGPSRRRM